MRTKFISILIVSCLAEAIAQNKVINIVPVVGVNSTRLNLNDSEYGSKFEKGGYYFVGGVEAQFNLDSKSNKRFHWTFVTGCNYLANGFEKSSGIAIGTLYYTYEKIDLKTRYVQFPVEMKLKWRPFPLIEDFHLFAGAGFSGNKLLSAKLAEEGVYSTIIYDASSPPPSTYYYSDEADVTDRGKKFTLFNRFEFGLEFERFQIGFRFCKALTNMYYAGLENDWAVPTENSAYLSGYEANGKILEKYSEVAVGIRVF